MQLNETRPLFCYCYPGCPSCTATDIPMGQVPWAIWSTTKKYSLDLPHNKENRNKTYLLMWKQTSQCMAPFQTNHWCHWTDVHCWLRLDHSWKKIKLYVWFKYDLGQKYILCTQSWTRPGFMTSITWQYISYHWDACCNRSPISGFRRTAHLKFDPTGVWSNGLQIMRVHFMSLRHLDNYSASHQWLGSTTHPKFDPTGYLQIKYCLESQVAECSIFNQMLHTVWHLSCSYWWNQ